MKKSNYIFIAIGLLFIIYLLGPKAERPSLEINAPQVTSNLKELEQFVNKGEASMPNIKPDNEAKIIWHDSIPKKTDYSIVYLHGWSASRKEGGSLPEEIAKRYGCNLFLPRLVDHGITEDEPMLNIKADQLLNSAQEAINIAKRMGHKVIIMSTSTGSTLSLYLAQNDPDIAGLVFYSPNIRIFDASSKILAMPWGIQIARIVTGGKYYVYPNPEKQKAYWTTKYRLEALAQLQVLIEETMKEKVFENISQPLFMGYYYKNEKEQDNAVSVVAALDMFEKVKTPADLKRKMAFPNAGNHVLASPIMSNAVEELKQETIKFMEEILGLKPVD